MRYTELCETEVVKRLPVTVKPENRNTLKRDRNGADLSISDGRESESSSV